MVNALQLVSVQRGYDPRDFVLVAFGGAGPAHANALARDVDAPTVLVPTAPGIFSATGLLSTDLKRDYTAALLQRADELEASEAEAAFAELEAEGRRELEREGVAAKDVSFLRQVELRYVGQSYELTVPADDVAAAVAGFHAEHDRAYGFAAEEEPVELVNLRLTAIGRIAKPALPRLEAGDEPEPRARRQVYFAESDGYVDCPVYDRYALGAGAILDGPAIVEEFDSTTVVHPGWQATVDDHGNLILFAV
jgi:N-methylhydantoinase A